jgi:hypothetical protein
MITPAMLTTIPSTPIAIIALPIVRRVNLTASSSLRSPTRHVLAMLILRRVPNHASMNITAP